MNLSRTCSQVRAIHRKYGGSSAAAPMNIKHLRAGPAEMHFRNWYTANTNHFQLTDSVSGNEKPNQIE